MVSARNCWPEDDYGHKHRSDAGVARMYLIPSVLGGSPELDRIPTLTVKA